MLYITLCKQNCKRPPGMSAFNFCILLITIEIFCNDLKRFKIKIFSSHDISKDKINCNTSRCRIEFRLLHLSSAILNYKQVIYNPVGVRPTMQTHRNDSSMSKYICILFISCSFTTHPSLCHSSLWTLNEKNLNELYIEGNKTCKHHNLILWKYLKYMLQW